MNLALRDMKQHKGRFLATILGVGLLFAIVLTMNGIYRGNIYEGTAIVKTTNPDLWVVERDRGGPINEQSILPEFFHYSVAAVPGVEKASPFIVYAVERLIKGKSRRFTIIGYDVFTGLGGPQAIYAGHPDSKLRQFAPDCAAVDMEAIVLAYQAGDQRLAHIVGQLGHYLSIAVSSLVTVANIPLVVLAGSVAGLGDDLVDAITSETQQRLLPMLAERTRVRASELGEEIIMLGAAALPLANELGIV